MSRKVQNPVYVVLGQTGEHEEKEMWVVCVHASEGGAIIHAKNATERAAIVAEQARKHFDNHLFSKRSKFNKKGMNEFDPDYVSWFLSGNPTYHHVAVPLEGGRVVLEFTQEY